MHCKHLHVCVCVCMHASAHKCIHKHVCLCDVPIFVVCGIDVTDVMVMPVLLIVDLVRSGILMSNKS